MTATSRCVILRALGLGDLLASVPALRAIARAFPLHERILCTPEYLTPLVELIGPAVDRVVDTCESTVLRGALGIATRPEVAINLHGRGPQSTRRLAELAPHRLVAFRSAAVDATVGAPEWRAGEHEVVRWCRLLVESGVGQDCDVRDLALRRPAPPRREWRCASIVHPGASAPARRWPADRFAVVARAEAARGRTVLITGSADERALACDVARRAGLGADAVLAGQLDLGALAAVVAHAASVCCGDTGIAHLATAFATPSVVMFGPTPPSEWGPPPRPRHRVLWAGRRGAPDASRPDPGLLAIDVPAVLHALDELPRR